MLQTDLSRLIEKYNNRRTLRKVLSILCCLTIVLTMNGLKYKADTLERIPSCGMVEHVHNVTCLNEAGECICGMAEHLHTDACFQERPVEEDAIRFAAEENPVVEEVVADIDVPVEELDNIELEGALPFDVESPGEESGIVDLSESIPFEESINPIYEETENKEEAYYFCLSEPFLLSGIIEELPVAMDEVIEAAQVVEDEEIPVIGVDRLEQDWLVYALEDFDLAELAVVTEDDILVLNMLDGRAVGDSQNSADEDPVPETVPNEEVPGVTEDNDQLNDDASDEHSAEETTEEEQPRANADGENVETVNTGNDADDGEGADVGEKAEGVEAVNPEDDNAGDGEDAGAEDAVSGVDDGEYGAGETGDSEAEAAEEGEEAACDDGVNAGDANDEDGQSSGSDDASPADEVNEAHSHAIEPIHIEYDLAQVDICPVSVRALIGDAIMDQTASAGNESAETADTNNGPDDDDRETADEELIEAEEVVAASVEAPAGEIDGELDEVADRLLPITYDETLLTVEAAGDDYLVSIIAAFDATVIHVGPHTITLLNGRVDEPYPSQAFTGCTDYVIVNVSADEGAFPEGTAMTVTDVDDEATISGITDKVEEGFVKVERVHAVDISFWHDGVEIEPLIPISVVMSVREVEEAKETAVVHVDNAGEAQIVEDTVTTDLPVDEEAALPVEAVEIAENGSSLGFTADAFSVYAFVIGEKLETKVIDANGDTYHIEVTYTEEAGIPTGATLDVTEVDGEGYRSQVEQNLPGNRMVTLARFFDIKIMSEGEEVPLKKDVQVKVWMEDEAAAEEEAANGEEAAHTVTTSDPVPSAMHFVETEDETVVIEKTARESEDAVVFNADGFSVWGVVYTVDFYYGNYEYHLDGGEEILLSELFEKLHIIEDVTTIGDAHFSDDELLALEKAENDWKLISLAPFDTAQMLTLWFKDGRELRIEVKDLSINLEVEPSDSGKIIVSGVAKNRYNNNKNSNATDRTFAAKANDGYVFDHWKLDNIDVTEDWGKSATIPVGTNINGSTLTAVFAKYNVTVFTAPSGTVRIDDIEHLIGGGTVKADQATGTAIWANSKPNGNNNNSITAKADSNSGFYGWLYYENGALAWLSMESTIPADTINLNTTGTIYALFLKTYVIAKVEENNWDLGHTIKVSNVEADTIEVRIRIESKSKKICNANSITAQPGAGYVFDYWDIDGVKQTGEEFAKATIAQNALTVDNLFDHPVLTAHFKEINVSFKATEGGTMQIGSDTERVKEKSVNSGELKVVQNGQIAEAFPEPGYRFVGWRRNNESDYLHWGDVKLYKSYVPSGKDCTFTAVFEKITSHKIYYRTNGTYGEVSPESEDAPFNETQQEFIATGSTATAKPGYRFVCWVDQEGTIVSNNATFVPTGDQIYEEATYTAVFEPASYASYLTIAADAPDRGYVVSPNYTNAVNGYAVSMFVQDDGTIPAEITAMAYEEWVFDHWTLNGEVLRTTQDDETSQPLGATLPTSLNFKDHGLVTGDNALVAHYVANANVPVHTIIYKAGTGGNVEGHAGTKTDAGDYSDTWVGSDFSTVQGAKAIPQDGWMFAGWKVQVKTTITKDDGTTEEVTTDVFPSYYADYVPSLDQIPDPSVTTVFTATFRPTGQNATDSNYNGMVGYNMNVANVPVYWSGPKDLVIAAANTSQTTTNYSTMYYDTNNGDYYKKGDLFHPALDVIPQAEGYFFVGWYNKNRPEYKNEDGVVVQPATEGNIIPRGSFIDDAGNNLNTIYFPYEGNNGSRYTFEAVFIGIQGDSKRLPYDGEYHQLVAEAYFEAGSVASVPRYNDQLNAIKDNSGYSMSAVQYQLLDADGKPVGDPTTEFKRLDPGFYRVRASATCTWSGETYTIYKDITLEIYPAQVIIKKIWNDNNNQYGIRPDDLDVAVMRYDPLNLYKARTTSDTATSRVVDIKNPSQMAAAKAEAEGKGTVSAGTLYGPRSGDRPSVQWQDKHTSIWTERYDNVLVRNNGFDETDQTSGYYLHFAEETVPWGYELVNETWDRSDDMLTTTITFTNQPQTTRFNFKKQWVNLDDNRWPTDASGNYKPIAVTLKRYFEPEEDEVSAATVPDAAFSVEFSLTPLTSITQNGYVVDYNTTDGFTIVGLPDKTIHSGTKGHWVYYLSEGVFDGYSTSYSVDSEARSESITDGGIITNTLVTYTLPSTGGPGTILYTLTGTLLILGAAFLLLRKHYY